MELNSPIINSTLLNYPIIAKSCDRTGRLKSKAKELT